MRFLLILLLSSSLFAQDHAAHQRAIESHLATRVAIEGVAGTSLEQRMKELGVPAVSFAVVDGGKIVLAAAYGHADVALGRRATTSTLFQAASISKPVTALAVMDLVERGRISLDANVNTILKSWQLPSNDLSTATPVTLRHLLSHSAGTTVHGFPGYAITAGRPSLQQVLEGKPPANTAAVVVDLAPNTKFRYSGGGTTLVQAALIDHTGLPFPSLMRRTVLQPLGMTSSTYEQPLPPSRRAQAATAYRANLQEVAGKWHVYPEMAAAGLWTTPSDLARVIIEIQNALAGRETKLLSIDAAAHMLSPRFTLDEMNTIGLGFFGERVNGVRYFGHGGSNEGFRALLTATADSSHGVVVMSNADRGALLNNELLFTIARAYEWPGYDTAPLRQVRLDDPRPFEGRFELESREVVAIRRTERGLELLDLTAGWLPLYAVEGGTLARADREVRYAATSGGLEIIADGKRLPARRLPPDAPRTADELLSAGEIEAAVAAYREQFRNDPQSLPEPKLNQAGYTFLYSGRIPQAVALLQLNTELYPTSANTFDSLGEALATAGETERAIRAYEQVLRLEQSGPLRENALSQLAKLRR